MSSSFIYLPDKEGATRKECHPPILPTIALPVHRGKVSTRTPAFNHLGSVFMSNQFHKRDWTFDTHRDGPLWWMPPESRSAPSKAVSQLIAFSQNQFCSELSVCCCTLKLMPYHLKILWPHRPAGLEELWFGINFDPLEGALSWEPACPVTAVVVLCQKKEGGVCVDLPHAFQNVNREKVQVSNMLKR